MHPVSKLVIVAAFGLTCAACSSNHGAPATGSSAPAASIPTAPPASAIPMQAPPASSASNASPEAPPLTTAPAFGVIMQRPSFANAFAAMDGAAKLPAWVKASDATNPSTRVQVEGNPMWLAHVCKTTACAGGQMFLLIDPSDHTMQGVFVETSGSAGASVRKLTWLGKPDPAAQKFLEAQAAQG